MGMPIITPSNTTRCEAITDIIESVSLEQAALSHILNAEGEKLQKIIKTATTSEQMLASNKSVNDMVKTVSMLEMLLQSKLQLFETCLCTECAITPCEPITSIVLTGPDTVKIQTIEENVRFGVYPDPAHVPVDVTIHSTPPSPVSIVGTLPTGFTLNGNVLTISSTAGYTSMTFNVGTGNCIKVIQIDFDWN
ncbi:MAG: hypothetical protein RR324_02480 [Cellulosilyticaceae bacterium]